MDEKIEFDQVFFNDDYDQYALMISNVRKQIKLNEDILKLRARMQKHVKLGVQVELGGPTI